MITHQHIHCLVSTVHFSQIKIVTLTFYGLKFCQQITNQKAKKKPYKMKHYLQ